MSVNELLSGKRIERAKEAEDGVRYRIATGKADLDNAIGKAPYRISSESLSEVNSRFNEQLEQQIEGTLPSAISTILALPAQYYRAQGYPTCP